MPLQSVIHRPALRRIRPFLGICFFISLFLSELTLAVEPANACRWVNPEDIDWLAGQQRWAQKADLRLSIESGQLQGLRLKAWQDSYLADQLGWRPGDRIKAINRISITQPQAFAAEMARLPSLPSLRLELEREGKSLFYQYLKLGQAEQCQVSEAIFTSGN